MTTFKEIRGKLIKTVASDPTSVANYEGEVWYNTTTGQLKAAAVEDVAGTWAATNPVATGMKNYSAAGIQTASFIAGGSTPANVTINTTQEYDGTSWTAANPVLQNASNRANSGAGTQTSGLMCGGYSGGAPPPLWRTYTEEYDGTSWTIGGNLNTGRWKGAAGGTQTAGLFTGGSDGSPPVNSNNVEEYNGASWTAVTAMATIRRYHAGFGVQTDFAAVGGYYSNPTSIFTNIVEEYDGTNWTAGTSYPVTIHSHQGFGSSTSAGVICGGTEPGGTGTLTNSYDGSAWTAQGSMANAYTGVSAVGTAAAGVIGSSPSTTASEEYTGPFQQVATKTLTTS